MTVDERLPAASDAPSRRVVVGVAESSAAHAAVEWAARRASSAGASLTLAHVTPPAVAERSLALPRLGPFGVGDLLTRERRFVRSIAPEVPVRTARLTGSVMWALGAGSEDADLVVVGTHKSGFIHGTAFGSTSLQLAATARCPVAVVPASAPGPTAAVVVGADGSPAGRAALAFGAAEAARLDTDLLIVRVLRSRESDGQEDPDEVARGLLLLEDLKAAAMSVHAGPIEARVLHGPIARVLVTMSTGAALLVLGDGRTDDGDDPLALGAVCHDALLNIQSPTAIVHVGDRAHLDAARTFATGGRSG